MLRQPVAIRIEERLGPIGTAWRLQMITSKTPGDWRALQNEVARILRECGFSVEVEKTLRVPRGTVEIDVYAEENVKGRKYSIVCECKNWRSRVPQAVIHGFRTVVAETGANVGYIISTNGFQTGAFTSAELTNIQLVEWNEFQNAFEESWYDSFLLPEITRRLDPLFRYVEPLLPAWVDRLSDEDAELFRSLKKKYDEFGWTMMTFTSHLRKMFKDGMITLPISDRVVPHGGYGEDIPKRFLEHVSYREFMEDALEYGEEAIAQFGAIRDKYWTGPGR